MCLTELYIIYMKLSEIQYEDIPEDFEHVIRFVPDMPEDPHTEEEHAEMALWNTRLQKLMEKERARSN